jgi:hypothetical protein
MQNVGYSPSMPCFKKRVGTFQFFRWIKRRADKLFDHLQYSSLLVLQLVGRILIALSLSLSPFSKEVSALITRMWKYMHNLNYIGVGILFKLEIYNSASDIFFYRSVACVSDPYQLEKNCTCLSYASHNELSQIFETTSHTYCTIKLSTWSKGGGW